VIFQNETDEALIVWLDLEKPPCIPDTSCTWTTCPALFYVGKGDVITQVSAASHQLLQPGQAWYIKLPLYDGLPAWGNTGSGAWVTKPGATMAAPGPVLRAEYNYYDKETKGVWYNLSGVEGVNSNMTMHYSGCPSEPSTSCNVKASDCPYAAVQIDGGGTSCASLKNPRDCGTCTGAAGHSACDLAGCGYSDDKTTCICRQWWRDNQCAQAWCQYLHNDCNIYCWAYDELIIAPGDWGETCKNHATNNPRNPLRRCANTTDGNLIVAITAVF